MRLICQIMAAVCLIVALFASFAGKYDLSAYLAALACFNKLSAMELE